MMKRPSSLLLLALFALACKSKDEAAPPTAESQAGLTAIAAPSDQVYAASSHLRIVDARAQGVVAKVDLGRAVRNLAFTPDGKVAVLAASDGLHLIDADLGKAIAQPTQHPARWVELDDSGTRALVLEHQVTIGANDVREISPFSLVTVELATAQIVNSEEVGQRILYARPATAELSGIVVSEAGEVALVAPGKALKEAQPFDLSTVVAGPSRIRHFPMVKHGVAYVPIEAEPARVVAIDLATRQHRVFQLDGLITLRGLALTPDRSTLVVNSGGTIALVDLKSGKVRAKLEPGAPSTGAALSSDGRTLYLAQTVDGDGGAVLLVDLLTQKPLGKIHLDDISPWALEVRPRSALAAR